MISKTRCTVKCPLTFYTILILFVKTWCWAVTTSASIRTSMVTSIAISLVTKFTIITTSLKSFDICDGIVMICAIEINMDHFGFFTRFKSRKENPQKPTQLSSRSHPRHLVGKRTAQKTPPQTPQATARRTATSQTGGHRPVQHSTTIFTYFYIYI